MRAPFLKMHGAGNDFVVFDERAGALALSRAAIARLADRRFGIGCDQLIRLHAPTAPGADIRMVIHNADGSVSATCGNATRCVASLLERAAVTVETAGGLLAARRIADGLIEVDMGAPRLDAGAVPLAAAADGVDTLHLPLEGDPAACSMGNPHATFFVDALGRLDDAALAARGSAVERDPLFPEGANVGFAQVLDRDRIRLRVWERGAGLTLACGSGACATLVNASRRGLVGREARVELPGGTLDIAWRESDGHVLMTGPVATVFRGSVELDGLPA